MKFLDIQKKIENLKIFSVEDLRLIDDKYSKRKILNWKNNGYIKNIIRGYYYLSSLKITQNILFEISNKIYYPSYISLESAFNYYGIIPEQVFNITCVSSRKTVIFNTDIGVFDYKKIKNDFFWGYEIVKIKNEKFLIAELEKSIIDYFYLNKNVNTFDDLKGLRFNKEELNNKLDRKKLIKYSKMTNKRIVEKRIDLLFKYIDND